MSEKHIFTMAVTRGNFMRTFWHINEFEYESMDVLPFAVFFSDQVVLWAPSSKRLNFAAREAGLNYDSQSLLKLVRSGVVRIAAREWWIMDPKRRDGQKWEHGHWDETFDAEIRRMAHADAAKPDARVIVCTDEDHGASYADAELEKENSPAVAAARLLYEHKSQLIPLGTKQRASRKAEGVGKPATRIWLHEILRDAYNHEWGRVHAAKADIAIETDEFPPEYALIGNRKSFEARVERVNLKRVIELAEICYELCEKSLRDKGVAPSLEDIVALKLEHRPEAEMQRFLCARFGATYENNELRSQLLEELQIADSALGGKMQHIFGAAWTGPVNAAGVTMGAVSAILSCMTRRSFLGKASAAISVAGFGCAGVVTGNNAAEWFSLKELSNYSGPRWPFLLRYGKLNPTREQLAQLVAEMRGIV